MRRTRIKICGLTRPEDAAAAVEAGADACGFVFAPSPRQLTVERAARLAALVPPPVARVGVFVDADRDEIAEAVRACGLTAVQLSGSEPPEACEDLGAAVIKVLKVGPDFEWSAAEPYLGRVSALLLDTYVAGKEGGTSRAFAWRSVGHGPDGLEVFCAGGLDAENVGEAISVLRPFAVDVSSGVESAPGIKDHEKIVAFCAAVRRADEEVTDR